jgi:hypothetical protein
VRAHRLPRHAIAARERARGGHRAPGHPPSSREAWFWSYQTNEFDESGPDLVHPDSHPADQPSRPADRVPPDWRAHLH